MARSALPNQDDLGRLLFRIVRKKKTCDLDEPLGECTSHSWTQVFLEVNRLNRTGQLCSFCKKGGEYIVTLPRAV
jgi:hypothetical protein